MESRIANAQLGQQMGRNILEGLRFQEQKRQYEEMKPFRNAQMELNQANITSQLLQNQQQLSALNRQNEVNASMAEALNLESGINRSQGGWVAPENKAVYLDFMKRNPSLAGSQWDQNMRRQFDTADKMAFEERKYKDLIQGRQEVAETRFRYGAQNANQASWDDLSNLIGETGDASVALDQIQQNASGPYAGKVKIAAQGMKSQIDALKRVGVDVKPEEVLDGWNRYTAGGGAMTADRKDAESIKSEDKAYTLLNQASQEIENFNKKYGAGAFDDYVGPFDNRRLRFQNVAINPKDLPAATSEANKIFQKVSQVIQGYRRGQFGTALTASESGLFKEIVSDPTYANYTDSFRNFRDNLGDSLTFSVGQYKLSPNVPLDIKKRWGSAYQGIGGATGQGAPIPTGQPQPASSGIKILGITPLP